MKKNKIKHKITQHQLKKKRDAFLAELGISKNKFKTMMPKVVYKKVKGKKTNEWDIASKAQLARGKGSHMGIRKQLVWLEELLEATREIREEMQQIAKDAEDKKEAKVGPTFKAD